MQSPEMVSICHFQTPETSFELSDCDFQASEERSMMICYLWLEIACSHQKLEMATFRPPKLEMSADSRSCRPLILDLCQTFETLNMSSLSLLHILIGGSLTSSEYTIHITNLKSALAFRTRTKSNSKFHCVRSDGNQQQYPDSNSKQDPAAATSKTI